MSKLVSCLLLAVYCANAVPISDAHEEASRIANGVIAVENQFPYVVSLQSLEGNSQTQPARGHFCGGVLITLQHVLTSSTCLSRTQNDGSTIWIPYASMQVFSGSVNLANSAADRVRLVANYTIHPDFRAGPAYLNDIAVITLTVPFPATTVTPLQLPPADFNPADFQLCSVAGWGATTAAANPVMSPNLRFANKYIYNQHLCTSVYSSLAEHLNVFPTMVCAASFDIISTGCAGDNGNALVCNNTLTGILVHHNNCSPTSFPEVYTRVNNYTTWIRSITGSATTFTPGVFMLSLLTISQVVFAKVVS